jgi:hypothetical protein
MYNIIQNVFELEVTKLPQPGTLLGPVRSVVVPVCRALIVNVDLVLLLHLGR